MIRKPRQLLTVLLLLLLAYLVVGKSQQFYPVDSANVWSYRVLHNNFPLPWDSSIVQTRVSGDTVLPNGHRYVRLSEPDVLGASLVRVDSAYIYYYSLQYSAEVAMYNLRSQPDVADSIKWGYYLSTSRLGYTTRSQLFGDSVTLRMYHFDGLVQYHVTLADRFGIVHAEDMGDTGPYNAYWDLRGCIIRDTSYGIVQYVPKDSGIPVHPTLQQNYPNPFNPTTEIKYHVSDFGLVTLKVYDILGREVATLVNERKPAGSYSVTFDGSHLASGVYFYRLQAVDFVEVKKLVVLR
jgi:hypothetical protein